MALLFLLSAAARKSAVMMERQSGTKKRAADMQTGPRRAAIVDKQAEYSSGKSLLNWLNLAVY